MYMEQTKTLLPKLLAVLVAIVLVFALFNIIKAFMPAPIPTAIEDRNYGLSTELYDEDPNVDVTDTYSGDLVGSLYFDSIALPEEGISNEDATRAANLYRYDFGEELTMPLVEIGESYDGNPLGPEEIAFITSLLDEQGNPTKAHVSMNTKSGTFFELAESHPGEAFELVLGEQGSRRAVYVFRSDITEDKYAIENYSLFFDNPYIAQTITIEAAVSPAWTMAGDLLLFLKRDGIYAYDMQTDTTLLLSDTYSDFGPSDRLSVSASSTFAVLTVPSLSSIIVFEPRTTETGAIVGMDETGLIQSNDVMYSTPVISPDGRFYAVVVTPQNGKEKYVEIRHYLSRDVISQFTPAGINPDYLALSAWTTYPVDPLPVDYLADPNEAED